jgi:hypothetical protein
MIVKKFIYNGKKLNLVKANRLIAKPGGGLMHKEMHMVFDTMELRVLHQKLNKMFGVVDYCTINGILEEKRVVKKKKVDPPKPQTVTLFGCFDEEIEV